MRNPEFTQLSVSMEVRDRLSRIQAFNKEEIIQKYNLKKRYVSVDAAIRYLLDKHES